MGYEELKIEGRNAVLEAFRSGKTIDKLFVLDGCQDGPVRTIVREAKKHDTIVNFVPKERLDSMSETGHHQGVMAYAAAYEYAEVEDILKIAEEMGYVPNQAAIQLKMSRSYVIGLYFSTISKMSSPFVLHDVLTGVYSVVGSKCMSRER